MSLSELMSSMDLAVYPKIALFIFLGVFVAVVWRIFTRRGIEECRLMATLPLDDGQRLSPAGTLDHPDPAAEGHTSSGQTAH